MTIESNQIPSVNVPVQDPPKKVLTREHLLELDLAQERFKCLSLQVGHLQLDDKLDEISIHNISLQQQVKAQELQLRRKDRDVELRKVIKMHSTIGTDLEDLKKRLGELYGISDWNKVAYNDLTGEISELPDKG